MHQVDFSLQDYIEMHVQQNIKKNEICMYLKCVFYFPNQAMGRRVHLPYSFRNIVLGKAAVHGLYLNNKLALFTDVRCLDEAN